MNIASIITLMEQQGVASKEDLVGVSLNTIAKAEKRLGVIFPDSYKLFLQSFGRSAGLLSTWMALYFDDLEEIRESFDERNAQSCYPFSPPKNMLIISCLNARFDYILCDQQDDPAVYRVTLDNEDGAVCELNALHFSDYLVALINDSNRISSSQYQAFYITECGEMINE